MNSHQERRFSRGKKTSFAPIRRGRMKFPNTAGRPGMMKRKIIMIPWSVKNVLYVCGSMMVLPGVSISRRIRNPNVTARRKNTDIETRYSSPIRLWSVLKIHALMPVYFPFSA